VGVSVLNESPIPPEMPPPRFGCLRKSLDVGGRRTCVCMREVRANALDLGGPPWKSSTSLDGSPGRIRSRLQVHDVKRRCFHERRWYPETYPSARVDQVGDVAASVDSCVRWRIHIYVCAWVSRGTAFERHCRAFAAADAQRGDASTHAAASERVQKCDEQSSARSADGVTQCTRASIEVQPVARNAESVGSSHCHDGERFIDLEGVDVGHSPADAVEQLANGRYRRCRVPLRTLAVG